MRPDKSPGAHRQSGAALLAAMVTVALVATLASTAMWLQWRQVEVEAAERGRSQTQWLMTGALDWTRLILAEDARNAQAIDHLGEPWALPVQESKLSTFLSQDQQWREGDPEVFLSGRISDAQSRLNLTTLVDEGRLSPTMVAAWARLFARLNLPPSELELLAQNWLGAWKAAQAASAPGSNGSSSPALSGRSQSSPTGPLLPQRVEQLAWLGLSPGTLQTLRPYIAILPVATPVNLNTADPLVLEAVVAGLDAATARQWVQKRNQRPWANVQEAAEALGPVLGRQIDPRWHDVKSRFFEIQGRLRMDRVVQDELALVQRDAGQVRMLWRQRQPQWVLTPGANLPPLQ